MQHIYETLILWEWPGNSQTHGTARKRHKTETKYLGVTIDDKLTWNSHTDIVTKRANQTTAFQRRNLPTCTKAVKAKCYKSLVRPQQYRTCCFYMGPTHQDQCNQSGRCPETGRQIMLQRLHPNQQCHFNVARARMGGTANKAPTDFQQILRSPKICWKKQ